MLKRCLSLFVLVIFVFAPAAVAADEVELALEEVLQTALSNNLDLVFARYTPQFAEQDIVTQESQFDVVYEAGLSHFEQKSAATQASTLDGFRNDTLNLGKVLQNLNFGADYSVAFKMQRNEQIGGLTTAPLSYTAGFEFAFTQPILKGVGQTTATEFLVMARGDYEVSRAEFEAQAQTTIETVEGAYWNVVAAGEAVRIAKLALERAQDLLDLNRKKVEVGTLAPIEITQAEAGVASQEEGVIVAEVDLLNAEDELRRLMAVPESDPMWAQALVLTSRPFYEEKQIDLDAAIATALSTRPELAGKQQSLRNRELNQRVAKKNTRHQLDFQALYNPAGADLDEIIPNPVPPPAFLPGEGASMKDALSNLSDPNQYDWTVGLFYRIPIGNHAAKADYARARISHQQAQVDLDNQEQTIRVQVRRAVRGVESGIKRVAAARSNVVLQQKKLDAEQKKFENGMSTSFEVLTFQNDLADAELSRIRALLDYAKALTALERSKGTLLKSHGLSLAN